MPKLSMLAITKRVDISILHEHNWEANRIVTVIIILFILKKLAPPGIFLQLSFKLNTSQTTELTRMN